MKIALHKVVTVILIAVAMPMSMVGNIYARGDNLTVPNVAYVEPKDESTVDLTGKDTLTFKWSPVPMPSGGRESFRFRLFKGFDYGSIFSQVIDHRTFSIDVPADKFFDGQTYSWRVEQRDGRTMIWSLYDTWSFKVIKK